MEIVWDISKDYINQKKHGISFEEAKSVFYDPLTKVAHDIDHSDVEDRFIAIGVSDRLNILLVVHCYKENDQILRIISARKLTKREKKQFEEDI